MIEICTPLANGVEMDADTKATINTMLISGGCDTMGPLHGADLSMLRNALIDRALQKKETTHVLFVDGDISSNSPLADLSALIKLERGIVGGAYTMRGTNHYCAVWMQGNTERYFTKEETGSHPCSWVGAGFLLIDRKTLEALKCPWFRHEIVEDVNGGGHETPEDVGFCRYAMKNGITPYVCLDTHLVHNGVDMADKSPDAQQKAPTISEALLEIRRQMDMTYANLESVLQWQDRQLQAMAEEIARLRKKE